MKKKEEYFSPQIEVCITQCEQGFATSSGTTEGVSNEENDYKW